MDNDLVSTVDILANAPGVKLVGLYAPEHGVRGDVHAGDKVDGTVDKATGVPVYSIYGKTLKPTPEMLKDVDVLIYDIQDNGCRSFTFISTMGKAMEACAEQGKKFMVLDRPNPIGGNKIEGNLVEDSCYSFVSQFPIPYVYGLTPGELARYLNDEGLIGKGRKSIWRLYQWKAIPATWISEQPECPGYSPRPTCLHQRAASTIRHRASLANYIRFRSAWATPSRSSYSVLHGSMPKTLPRNLTPAISPA